MNATFDRVEGNKELRGHEFFSKGFLEATPPLYATEETPAEDKIITGHFFRGGTDWFVAEFDPETGEVFCFVILNDDLQNAEWGYSGLFELELLLVKQDGVPHIVERDVDWKPTRFAEIERVKPCLR